MSEKLIYLQQSDLTELETKIKKVEGNVVEFEKTIIYPGGGGQPMDIAHIIQNSKEFTVLDAQQKDDTIIYTLDDELNSKQPVLQLVNKTDREQKCQYHTLLHLIAAVAGSEYECRVSSSEILDDHTRIELLFPTNKKKSEFDQHTFWDAILTILSNNHPVTTKIINRKNINDESTKVRTVVSLIPKEISKIRLVTINNLDTEACAGTHVSNTNKISKNLIFTTKSKGSKKIRAKVEIIS
ncbi:alanyl-tRNA editing protein [Leuconostoc gasicomitatum]|uniref:alanyl-tRNA editing protein n=1 Tax=Leuconostoc gasicomitatum TaxID=115778 RepID=UPI001CC594B8|nr:alanyl-tRNA editing protein [Leuconostoc gasicomitatum]MBZ5972041.1 alanyl-tRNA editing protein [Leuconostoc gasicomitatum]